MTIGWISKVLSLEIRRKLSYRIDFWLSFSMGVLAELTIAYVLWSSLFEASGAQQFGGYSLSAMMLYYLLTAFVVPLIRGADIGAISNEIYEGGLTKYLLYPVSFFGYKGSVALAHSLIYAAQLAVGAGLFFIVLGAPSGVEISLESILLGFSFSFCAMLVYFLLFACIELISFWADNIWNLIIMVRFITALLGGELLPLTLFPDWSQALLHSLPFAYFASFPVRCFLGEITFPEYISGLGMLLIWGLFFGLLLKVVWNRGSRRYTGVGI